MRLAFIFMISVISFVLMAGETTSPALKPHPKAISNIHPPGEVDRPEMVKFVVADPASLPGIVVDETAAELVGEWQYSTHTPPYVGLGYLHDMKAGKGTKSVTFTPTLREGSRLMAGSRGSAGGWRRRRWGCSRWR